MKNSLQINKSILLVLLCTIYSVCYSQNVQSILFNSANDERIVSFVETENKDIIGVGYTRELNWGDNAMVPKMWIIHNSGDTLTNTFNFPDSIASFNKIFINEGRYHIFGNTNNNGENYF